jgi:excisionase family DNA binding protein
MPRQIGDLVFYTIDEISEKTGITQLTLRKYAKEGRLRAKKQAGRYFITEQAIQEFFEGAEHER